MKQLHPLQLQLLQRLLFAPSLRYSDLRPNPDIENNQLDFHLDKMIEAGYVAKIETGYALTPAGKEYAGRIDTENTTIKRQGKLGTIIACVRTVKGEREFLVYTRLKQPFYGCQGFLTGKIQFGENVTETAERELTEETGLSGTAEIVRLIHYRVFHEETQELLEDKYLFLCRIAEPTIELIEKCEEGEYMWVTESEIPQKITNPFETLENFINQAAAVTSFTGQEVISEVDHSSAKF